MTAASRSPAKPSAARAQPDAPQVAVKQEDEEYDLEEEEDEEDEEGAVLGKDEVEADDLMDDSADEDARAGRHFLAPLDPIPPLASRYVPIKEIFDMLRTGKLELDPPYQRESVWKLTRRQGLIASLFHGRPVMSLYFAVYRDKDGNECRNVLDGKQRLTTLNLFLRGKIPYKDKVDTGGKNFYWRRRPDTPATAYILPQDFKTFLEGVTIECIEYHNLTMPQEESIFQCIQQGVALTQAEKMRIGDEPGRTFIRELAEERLAKPVLSNPKLINLKVNNGQDFYNLASFIYCAQYLPDERAHATKTKLQVFLSSHIDFRQTTKELIDQTLDDFWELVREYPEPFVTMKQKVAPIECIFILLFLYITRDLDLKQRSEDVKRLREVVHEKHKGQVRSNPRVIYTLWQQIDLAVLKYQVTGTRLPAEPPREPGIKRRRAPAKGRRKALAPRAAVAVDRLTPEPEEESPPEDAMDEARAPVDDGSAELVMALNSAIGNPNPNPAPSRPWGQLPPLPAESSANGSVEVVLATPRKRPFTLSEDEEVDELDDRGEGLSTGLPRPWGWSRGQQPMSVREQQEREKKRNRLRDSPVV